VAVLPELPDLVYIRSRLREALVGRHVVAERVTSPVVMRFLVKGNLSLLLGHPLEDVVRHAHFLGFRFGGFDLAVNPMLAGRFRLAEPGSPDEATLAFALSFDGSVELRYLDEKSMGKAYLMAAGDWNAIPGLQSGGLDVLSPEFTKERFVSALKHRRDQVRVFLMDKRALDSIGNAYADEVLFEAGLHPKTPCSRLSHEEAVRLHDAIVKVLREAVDEVERRAQPIDVKVRDFLKIRRRDTCPRCGGKIRVAGVRSADSWFCPTCQPARKAGLVDWTRTRS
jgi:formamidopyrimidine-DNA glycosylase